MLRNFDFARDVKWKSITVRDPRVAMRFILGVLLLANLVTAVIAFRPFGGSADDLRREQASLQSQLMKLKAQVASSKRLVDKVETARREGDQFLAKFMTDRTVMASTLQEELVRMATAAGVTYLPTTMNLEPIEGSDTLSMMTINAGCQGTYANLSKFVNLVDRSPRFLIIENMVAAPRQSGLNLNVSIKVRHLHQRAPTGGGNMKVGTEDKRK
jgi:type IV pilus assembly protein PilO